MTARERLYQLIASLPDEKIPVALSLLEDMGSEDDEPLTPEDLAALAEADEDIRQGRVTPWEQARQELGIEL